MLEKRLKTSTRKESITCPSLQELPNITKVNLLTVKVVTKSRVIQTARGDYQICTIKDREGNTTSLNLYSKQIDKVEVFKIYNISNLRKGDVVKDGKTYMRLHCNSCRARIGSRA